MVHAKNKDVRDAIKSAGLLYWEVAAELGISDGTFSRKLRAELPSAEKDRIMAVIETLAKEGKADA